MRASHHKQQRTSDRRGLGAALCVGGCDRSSPAAHDKAQGRADDRPVGNISKRGPATNGTNSSSAANCSTVSPVTRLRGIAILRSYGFQFARHRSPCGGLSVRRLGSFSSHAGRAAIHSYAARGGRIGELCYAARLSAKFSRRLTESRAHQLRIGHEPGSNGTDPLHLERLSYGFVAIPNHRTSGVVNVGKEVVGERNVE